MSYIGREKQIVIGGKSYTLARLSRKLMRDFADWVKASYPDPVEVSKPIFALPLSTELHKIALQNMWDASYRKFGIDSREVRDQMLTLEGGDKLFALMLNKHHPEITETDAFELSQQYQEESIEKLIEEYKQLPLSAKIIQKLKERNVSDDMLATYEQQGVSEEVALGLALEDMQKDFFRYV